MRNILAWLDWLPRLDHGASEPTTPVIGAVRLTPGVVEGGLAADVARP